MLDKPYYKEYYQKNKKSIRENIKRWRDKNPEKVKQIQRNQYWKRPEVNRMRAKRYVGNIKNTIYVLLGGYTCIKCGFKDPRALQIDHIRGGGKKDRKQHRGYYQMIKYYYLNPELAKKELQILCANCNQIKKFENHELFYKYKST